MLPQKDPEVAAALEEELLRRGVRLLKGARATAVEVDGAEAVVRCDDGRVATGSHALLAIGSMPNSEGLGLEAAGITADDGGYVPIDQHCRTNVPTCYAAGDLSGKLPLSSVAAMQGRRDRRARDGGARPRASAQLDYDKAASAIFTVPEIADVGLAEADAFAEGRKVRVTKVPFSGSPKALIESHTKGFVKIVSDPATGVVLGGSVVGRHAGRAGVGDRRGRHRTGCGSATSSTASSCTRPCPRPWPRPRSRAVDGAVVPALVAAGLLVFAGAMKVVDPTMTSGALREFGLPSSPALVRLLALTEVVLGVVAIVAGGTVVWTLVAASYIAFGAFVVAALRADAPIGSCGCFGRLDTQPHWLHVVIDVGIWLVVVSWVVQMDRAPLDELTDHPGTGATAVAGALALIAFVFAGFTGAARAARATR